MAAKKETAKTKKTTTRKQKSSARKFVEKEAPENISMSKSATSMLKFGKRFKGLGSNKYYYILAVILIIAGVLYLARGLFVVALVNGRPITRLKVVKQLESQGGSQVVDSLITQDLIQQEVEKRGISVSDQEIQDEIDRISGIVEGQGTTLDDALALRGQTMDDLRENIMLQKSAEKILQDSINVTDQEAKDYFEQNKSYYEDGAKYEDLSDDIKEQLKQQKLQSEFQKLIDQLKSDANIVYFVNY